MGLQSSGSISFSQIRTEFQGGSSSLRIGKLRRDDAGFSNKSTTSAGGSLDNLPLDTGVPTSGSISASQLHGKKLNVIVDGYSGTNTGGGMSGGSAPTWQQRLNARTAYDNNHIMIVGGHMSNGNQPAGGGDSSTTPGDGAKVIIHINKNIGGISGRSEKQHVSVRTGSWESGTQLSMEFGPSAHVRGAGGDGGKGGDAGGHTESGEDGEDGNSAVGIEYNGTHVEIESGAIINKGYGGGGGAGGVYHEDEEDDESSGGGGGGGGQGWPAGDPGEGGDAEKDGQDGGEGSEGEGGEWEGGEGGQGGETEENHAGEGGDGGGNEGGPENGESSSHGSSHGARGLGGESGDAFRKSNDELGWSYNNGGTVVGTVANRTAESGGEGFEVDGAGGAILGL